MELKCIQCGDYYHIDEHNEEDRARGLHLCSVECLYKMQTKQTNTTVEQEPIAGEFVIGSIGEEK